LSIDFIWLVRRLHHSSPGATIKRRNLMRFLWLILLVLATIPLAGCELAGNIFQAGMWVGAIFIVLIIAVVGFIAAKISG
jgi:uncharacterized membrane protein YkvI